MTRQEIPQAEIDSLYERLKSEAEASGYYLNPDVGFVKGLVEALLVNEERYGYQACPCRLAAGKKKDDIDIICPCDYRDPDINEYGACYCALYVSEAVAKGQQKVRSIPERRLPPAERKTSAPVTGGGISVPMTVWRCKVCGYLCAREQPPDKCPICKVTKDRFEKFLQASG